MPLTVQQASQLAFGAAGCTFGSRTAVATDGAGTKIALPIGWHFAETDAHGFVKVTYDGGTNFVTVIGNSAAGFVYSDGYNTVFVDDNNVSTCHRSLLLGF